MNIATLRHELNKILSDEDLNFLCFDHFRAVYDRFSSGQTRTERIQLLLEHVERSGEIARLADLLGLNNALAPSPPQQSPTGDDLCLEIVRSRARLNTLIDVAELIGEMPGWLHEKIQREHDLLHDAKVAMLRW